MGDVLSNQKVQLEVVPVAGRIGAEVKGIVLSPNLDHITVDAIQKELWQHKVLFFRGQQHLDDAGQEGFARLLGEPYAHPTVPVRPGTDYMLELDSTHVNRANVWHTDITFVDAYPKISILRAVVVPQTGGDTVWANTASAYQDLPEALRAFADRLWALHTNDHDYALARNRSEKDEEAQRYTKVFSSTVYKTEHPVVHVHPETGERHLLLGNFVRKIMGFSSTDSERLFSLLQGYVTRLENTVRWRWSAGDVVIWDNRATQHYAIDDYGDQHRVVRRVTIGGSVPVSLDGRHSVTQLSGGNN